MKIFNKPSIYQIKNLLNNKLYIGSTAFTVDRKYYHFRKLKLNQHSNQHLQKSFNKYGIENFVFEIIEYVEKVNDTTLQKDLLLKKEQYYIDTLNPQYNILKVAGSHLGFKKSPEQILRSKLAHIGIKRTSEQKETQRLRMLGTKQSEETKNKRSVSMKKNGWHPTKEILLQANSTMKIKFSKPILQLDLEGNLIKEWESIRNIARVLKYHRAGISKCCRKVKNYKTAYGFIWKFKNN